MTETIDQISQQLSSLTTTLKETQTLIHRLSTLSFSPGSELTTSSSEEPDSVRLELTQDIHDTLKQLDEDLELLKQEVDDLSNSTGGYRRRESTNERDRDRARLSAQVARLGADLRGARGKFRRAQLEAKKASEVARQKEREIVFASLSNPEPVAASVDDGSQGRDLLFAGRRPNTPKLKRATKEEQEVDASTSVTTALRRTHDLLSTELSRSRFAQETFDQSTAALAELGEKYDSLDSILKGSRELLGTLLRSQKSDTWYLETAFYILIATLGWLIFRRILLGPFIRLPLFILNWFIWKPLYSFLWVTGIITTETVAVSAAGGRSTTFASTRTPLIVQPSAGKDSIPRFDPEMAEKMRQSGGVPVGAGGKNAKVGKDGGVMDDIRRMVGGSEQGDGKVKAKEEVKRGDGTVLEERGEVPRNPKKKVFEDVGGKAEEQAQQPEDKKTESRKRDEL